MHKTCVMREKHLANDQLAHADNDATGNQRKNNIRSQLEMSTLVFEFLNF